MRLVSRRTRHWEHHTLKGFRAPSLLKIPLRAMALLRPPNSPPRLPQKMRVVNINEDHGCRRWPLRRSHFFFNMLANSRVHPLMARPSIHLVIKSRGEGMRATSTGVRLEALRVAPLSEVRSQVIGALELHKLPAHWLTEVHEIDNDLLTLLRAVHWISKFCCTSV